MLVVAVFGQAPLCHLRKVYLQNHSQDQWAYPDFGTQTQMKQQKSMQKSRKGQL
jgi:hypothetical protein